jgi:hypothetical protein
MRHKGKACVNEDFDPGRLPIQYLAGTLFTELDAATLDPNYRFRLVTANPFQPSQQLVPFQTVPH